MIRHLKWAALAALISLSAAAQNVGSGGVSQVGIPPQSGNAGKVLTTSGSKLSWTGGGGINAPGSSGQLIYNNSGAFGAESQCTIAQGCTGQSTALAGFNALLPGYTWATNPSAASNSGKVIFDSDVGDGGSFFVSNGTYWKPTNGGVTLCHGGVVASVNGTLSKTQLATCSVPAAAMGNNGELRVWTYWSTPTSTNSKSIYVEFSGLGGTAFTSTSSGANISGDFITRIINQNSQSVQVGHATGATFGFVGGSPVRGAVNTNNATTVSISGQLTNSGDTLILEAWRVELLP